MTITAIAAPAVLPMIRIAPRDSASARETAEQQAEARKRRAEGATLDELARSYHVGKSTISQL
jgi:hypothetical protein